MLARAPKVVHCFVTVHHSLASPSRFLHWISEPLDEVDTTSTRQFCVDDALDTILVRVARVGRRRAQSIITDLVVLLFNLYIRVEGEIDEAFTFVSGRHDD